MQAKGTGPFPDPAVSLYEDARLSLLSRGRFLFAIKDQHRHVDTFQPLLVRHGD
jgi:hypothetical protein